MTSQLEECDAIVPCAHISLELSPLGRLCLCEVVPVFPIRQQVFDELVVVLQLPAQALLVVVQ